MKQAGCHTFRHSFATQLLEAGIMIFIFEPLGVDGAQRREHNDDVTHILSKSGYGVRSPADMLMDGLGQLVYLINVSLEK